MDIHINDLFLLPPNVDYLFLLTFGNKKCTLKLYGLIFGGERGLFVGYFRVSLIYQNPRLA